MQGDAVPLTPARGNDFPWTPHMRCFASLKFFCNAQRCLLGFPKGIIPFGGFLRQSLKWGLGQSPSVTLRYSYTSMRSCLFSTGWGMVTPMCS